MFNGCSNLLPVAAHCVAITTCCHVFAVHTKQIMFPLLARDLIYILFVISRETTSWRGVVAFASFDFASLFSRSLLRKPHSPTRATFWLLGKALVLESPGDLSVYRIHPQKVRSRLVHTSSPGPLEGHRYKRDGPPRLVHSNDSLRFRSAPSDRSWFQQSQQ